MERQPGKLYIGESIDAESGDRTGTAITLDSADFTTHGVIVGMTGSGKTGLGVVLLEEALQSGIPVLAIDPKGDLSNLCLTFPSLEPNDFRPWIDEGTARVEQTTVDELATKTANLWKSGLASWDHDGTDVARLAAAADPVVYTPGSAAGIPLNVMGNLAPPESDDPSIRQDEADSTVSGLLGLVGVESDPLSGREHILLSNLMMRSWDAGTSLDLATLLGQLMDPPIRKLGVLDLETFYPAKDRQTLVLKLNGLLASPSFAAWSEGAPLDIASMLWKPNGDPRAAIVSLGHLDEIERHFAITLVLSKLISWMRAQSGTGELRVLVYIDEVMGLAPPSGNPAPKKPILTLLKQARAFGVGLVLSTQNPVDLDYKAISNAGTWLIGRLQTEQDKNRLIDGLRSADGAVDIGEVERTISGLGKRQFMLRTTRSSELKLLATRWALSYLAGPLTRDQISTLMDSKRDAIIGAGAANAGSSVQSGEAAPTTSETSTENLASDESPVPPTLPDSLPMRYVHASAPWLAELGGAPDATRLVPYLAARVNLLFDETKADLRHQQEWEALVPLDQDQIDLDRAVAVDFDDRDFVDTPPANPAYVFPAANLTSTVLRSLTTEVKRTLRNRETLTLQHNAHLKLWSRPNEATDDFERRCSAAADDAADVETNKLRDKLEKKATAVNAALAKAEDRVAELEGQSEGRRNQNIVDLGSSLLGGLLGGRSRTKGMASAARRAMSGSRQSASTKARLETARNRAVEKIDQLEQLEYELQEAIVEIDDEWNEKAADVESVEIPLEQTDITVEDLILVWLPVER